MPWHGADALAQMHSAWQHGAARHSTARLARIGVAQHGTAWHGKGRCGAPWCGTERHGIAGLPQESPGWAHLGVWLDLTGHPICRQTGYSLRVYMEYILLGTRLN
jgi:hypothetical protein